MIETIDADTDVMSPTSLALDSYGFAHIVYSDIALDALRHAYWDGSVWNVETIDGWGEWAGYFNSMAIDKQDNVHVAYCTSLEETLNGYYRLRYAKRGPTAIAEAELTGRRFRYRLFQNSPNPFSRSTKIRFQVPWAGLVSVRIYDVTGREVKVLATGKAKAGPHEVVWNGTDTAARRLPSGVYFCQMKSGGFVSTRKLLLIR
ncbi:MAG: FlgD immunoglobulin-like domain containing protein [bacterium]